MVRRCTCTAGSEANGWHQDWCDDCRADELRQWSQCVAPKESLESFVARVRLAREAELSE